MGGMRSGGDVGVDVGVLVGVGVGVGVGAVVEVGVGVGVGVGVKVGGMGVGTRGTLLTSQGSVTTELAIQNSDADVSGNSMRHQLLSLLRPIMGAISPIRRSATML